MTGNDEARRSRRSQRALVAAWQAALSAEHQAVFGYGVLGPHLPATEQFSAQSMQHAHELMRDATTAALTTAGHEAPPPAADYPLLYPADNATQAIHLAIALEDACAAAWRFCYLKAASLVAPHDAARGDAALQLRRSAQSGLNASAVRATQWRALTSPNTATTAFPGI